MLAWHNSFKQLVVRFMTTFQNDLLLLLVYVHNATGKMKPKRKNC